MEVNEIEWVVWCHERDMFWKPRKVGYTDNIEEAGRYDLATAAKICADANDCGIMQESMFPFEPKIRLR